MNDKFYSIKSCPVCGNKLKSIEGLLFCEKVIKQYHESWISESDLVRTTEDFKVYFSKTLIIVDYFGDQSRISIDGDYSELFYLSNEDLIKKIEVLKVFS